MLVKGRLAAASQASRPGLAQAAHHGFALVCWTSAVSAPDLHENAPLLHSNPLICAFCGAKSHELAPSRDVLEGLYKLPRSSGGSPRGAGGSPRPAGGSPESAVGSPRRAGGSPE